MVSIKISTAIVISVAIISLSIVVGYFMRRYIENRQNQCYGHTPTTGEDSADWYSDIMLTCENAICKALGVPHDSVDVKAQPIGEKGDVIISTFYNTVTITVKFKWAENRISTNFFYTPVDGLDKPKRIHKSFRIVDGVFPIHYFTNFVANCYAKTVEEAIKLDNSISNEIISIVSIKDSKTSLNSLFNLARTLEVQLSTKGKRNRHNVYLYTLVMDYIVHNCAEEYDKWRKGLTD
jgi:hypothetical protein